MVLSGNLSNLDVAKFVEIKDLSFKHIKEDFIFENLGVENDAVRQAFMLIETLRAYKLNPHEIISKIMNSSIREHFIGLAKLAFDDYDYFVRTILEILGLDPSVKISEQSDSELVKVAQQFAVPSSFWFMGLLEKMLEPVRGPDLMVHQELEKDVQAFWNEVELVKKSRKNEGVPFDMLLRIKSKGYETEPNKTIQALLSSVRVW